MYECELSEERKAQIRKEMEPILQELRSKLKEIEKLAGWVEAGFVSFRANQICEEEGWRKSLEFVDEKLKELKKKV